jgi:hypothetical protein
MTTTSMTDARTTSIRIDAASSRLAPAPAPRAR